MNIIIKNKYNIIDLFHIIINNKFYINNIDLYNIIIKNFLY